MDQRKQKFKPILQQEINTFAEQVEQIVNHLNMKRKEERDRYTDNKGDLEALKTQMY